MSRTSKNILRTLGAIIVAPVLLVCLLVVLVYCPPVQKWLINEVGERMESSLGMKVHIDDVRITPFLDLVAGGVVVTDTEGDTLLATRQLTFDVAFRPLFEGRADINGFLLDHTLLNTKSLISDCNVRGTVGRLTADAEGVEWNTELVHLKQATLQDADLLVALSDTAAEDTTETHIEWVIDVDRAHISRSHIALTLAPDSCGNTMGVDATIGSATLQGGMFDLGVPHYAIRQLDLTHSAATVTDIAAVPMARRDTMVNVSDFGAVIDTLSYDACGALRCGVRNVALDESRYGIHVREISGGVYLDSTRIEVPALNFHTLTSRINAGISLDWKALQSGNLGQMKVNIDAAISRADVQDVLQMAVREGYLDRSLLKNDLLRPYLNSDVNLQATVSGNLSRLNIEHYNLILPRLLSARGNMTITDDFNAYAGRIAASLYGGSLSGRFATNLRRETYDVDADVSHLVVSRIVKDAPVGPFSGHITAKGRGFDPTSAKSSVDAHLHARQLKVMDYDLSGLLADATLSGGFATADIALSNALGSINGNIDADLRQGYNATACLELNDVQLDKLTGGNTPTSLHSIIELQATASKDLKTFAVDCNITDNFLSTEERSAEIKDVALYFATSPRSTTANVQSGDLTLQADIDGDLDRMGRCYAALTKELQRQMEQKSIDQQALRALLPHAAIAFHAKSDNPLHNYLRFQGTQLGPIDIDLTTDSTEGINGLAQIGSLEVAGQHFDTIYAHILQDDEGIKLRSTIQNYKRTNPNRFTATIDGNILATGLDVKTVFTDEKGRIGTDLRVLAEMADGRLTLNIDPKHTIFAYQKFSINKDNFVSISKQGVIRADMRLKTEDGTGLSIYSEPSEETSNDVTLSITNLNLRQVCDAMPYLPRLDGMINGDIHVLEEHAPNEKGVMTTTKLSGMGTIDATDFAYEGTYIGNIGSEIIYLPKENGEHYADAFITFNGKDVGECSGVYYDTDDHFNGDVVLNDFPLTVVNAFLEGTDFLLRGAASGEFNLYGTLDKPVMDGTMRFNDAHFYSPVYGVDFKMEERDLKFAESRLNFSDYLLTSGPTHLKVNGDISVADISDPSLNLTMQARNFELINTRRQTSSLIYGKVLADFNATARGCLDNLIVRGQLNILPTTDATYLLTNSPLTVEDRLADLVTFMDFSDTTTVATAEEEREMALDLSIGINIDDGAEFHCFLSSNGSSYVDVQGGGNLTLRMTRQGDMRLTGRYTIQEGEMNYELPVIPLKKFSLTQGSYVEFTGDMMNPYLSISATEQTKALVSTDDVQRSVNFIVGVDISRTLQDMGLAFTIEAPEDLNVQNQLAAMSEEDRYKSAVALLATGMFVTENLTSGLKASNALNAFLQSEIQNIAGKALSTIDLSFGMENGTSAAGTLTTDYSFRFSKRFLDDRISINIGGSVSTGADARNDAASFIDNISLEYRLDNSGTRYVRIFYDRDSHDPLEGSMMKTGAGLILRRKTDRLSDLFLFRKPKSPTPKP